MTSPETDELRNDALSALPLSSSDIRNDAIYARYRKSISAATSEKEIRNIMKNVGEDEGLRSSSAFLMGVSEENTSSGTGTRTPFVPNDLWESTEIQGRLSRIAKRFGLEEATIQGDGIPGGGVQKQRIKDISSRFDHIESELSFFCKRMEIPENNLGLGGLVSLQFGNPESQLVKAKSVQIPRNDGKSTIIINPEGMMTFDHEFAHALDHAAAHKAKERLNGIGRKLRVAGETFVATSALNGNDPVASLHEVIRSAGEPDFASKGTNGRRKTGDIAVDAIATIMESAPADYADKTKQCDIRSGARTPYYSDPTERFARIFEAGSSEGRTTTRCLPVSGNEQIVKTEGKKAILDISSWRRPSSGEKAEQNSENEPN